jgi:hypothetical protein
MAQASKYLVVSGTGEAPRWHDDYASALADVRRRMGRVTLHPSKGRTRRTAAASERTFVHGGVSWNTAYVEEYAPDNYGQRLTVYRLEQQTTEEAAQSARRLLRLSAGIRSECSIPSGGSLDGGTL